jgi:dolichol-phosphate mannosyltransferase
MNKKAPIFLSLVVPVYNEEKTIGKFLSAVEPVLKSITEDYEIIFSADPCTDRTIPILLERRAADPRIKIMVFSRHFGQPAAILAGLSRAGGQVVIPIDCDLQDPPGLIVSMVELWRQGYKVVLPQRQTRHGETWPKRAISYLGYWFINRTSQVPIPRNTGEFRLMDKRVVDEVVKLGESHGFLRGLVAVVGFKTAMLPFDRPERVDGEGKYNRFTGSLRIGFNGIIGFSDYLLNLMVKVGFAFSAFSMLAALLVVYLKFGQKIEFASGVPSMMILMLFLGGTQLVGMGILGAYISRIYEDVKRRPRFIVDEQYGLEPAE